MLTKSDKFAWGYYCGPYEPPGESKGSGSSGQIDNEIVASEDSSAPTRKCIALNLDKDYFNVIKHPMDLGTVKKKMASGAYANPLEFHVDEHGSNGTEPGEENEIDIDDLSDDTLFSLRKLLHDYVQEKQKNQSKADPCEIGASLFTI
ncbi:hypothetical protein V6N12_033851 [Hibiscus sabdariffa]|uniref:Bromo domain-containing protein n=1 Tax=Hibiscus sabdariffa TaxID=183260 RepID=A0ABR1ZG95_9ROSI